MIRFAGATCPVAFKRAKRAPHGSEIAGAGDRLQLTRTYSSFTGAGGTLGTRWWASYDRRLQISGTDVYVVDSTGGSAHFTATGTSGAYTTPAGYSQDLVKNSDGRSARR